MLNNAELVEGTDYTVAYANNVKAGTAKVTITGIGANGGEATGTFRVRKAAQPMKLSAATRTQEYYPLVSSALTVASPFTVAGAQGTVTYGKVSGDSALSVNASSGKVTVAKGTAVGTYKINVRVSNAGNDNYESGRFCLGAPPKRSRMG